MERNIFKDIREKNGMSQEEMAARLFVTRQAVSRWENGDTMPNIDTLKRISTEFGVPANELLGLENAAFCQSCGMDLKAPEDFGSSKDGGIHAEYCKYCMQKGSFTSERTIDEMVETNLKFLDEYNAEKGLDFTPEQARVELRKYLATLKRWKNG